MLRTSMPVTAASRRRISRPVVPASPSMKTAGLVAGTRALEVFGFAVVLVVMA